jgi:hypothetical protein
MYARAILATGVAKVLFAVLLQTLFQAPVSSLCRCWCNILAFVVKDVAANFCGEINLASSSETVGARMWFACSDGTSRRRLMWLQASWSVCGDAEMTGEWRADV